MVFAQCIYVFLGLACCVSAYDWDDFANNLATDLAPLISLFGEQITTQCMSELISTLDDYIFALVPLGILTAVVSMIRVCGNSTLRAFIGRAHEDPGSSEVELLSCVSDTAAEVFTESGVARITGNPKILEIVANESGSITVQKVSDIAGKSWPTDLEKDANLPNLSLNKGIRRRAPFWFHLAALFGTGLQLAILVYAALTVLQWPETFLKDGSRVDGYALPLFLIGTVLLTLGMFFCALLVERFSRKHTFRLPKESRVYWIQPGNQEVGDQIFPSFVGQTEKGVEFTRSVRHHSSDDVLTVRKEVELVSIVSLTMVGFVLQFVGLRGLHSSVILAQLGSTMVMTVVRTCLRAQRMHEGDNMLKDDQGAVCKGEHELDWLVFHLFKLQSFKIRPASTLPAQRPQTPSDSVALESLMIRRELTKLSGSHWNNTPARKLAYKLGQATQDLMKLISSWSDKDLPYFDIAIPFEVEKEGSQQSIPHDWEKRLSATTSIDVDFWEAMIGLYVWSLKQANLDLREEYRDNFFRAFDPKNKNSHQARLLYQKWTNDKSVLDQNQTSSMSFLNGCQTFGHSHFCVNNSRTTIGDAALVAVSSDLYTLAAQDIYMHILRSLLERLPEIGGTTQITGKDRKDYKVSNDRIEQIIEGFVKAGLGDKRGGMACILSVLSDKRLLPEFTYESVEVRRHMLSLEKSNDKEIYTMSEWLCSVADHGEAENALVEYGYICLRNMMSRDDTQKAPSLERIMAILNVNDNSQAPISKNLVGLLSEPAADWRERYRNEMYWISSRILQFQTVGSHSQQTPSYSQQLETQYATKCSMKEAYTNQETALSSQAALLDIWFELDFGSHLSNDQTQIILDWLVTNKHDNILEWFVMRMIADLSPNHLHDNMRKMITYAAAKEYKKAVIILLRHIDKFNMRAFIIEALASEGDVKTIELLLGRDFSRSLTKEHENALLKAAERSQFSVLKFFLEGGVNPDVQNSNDVTALMIAADEGDIETVSLLLSYNASVEKRENTGDTALIIAAASGHLNVVELLINKGANINAVGYRGRTALMAATLGQNLPLVKYLCDHKADIRVLNVDQMSALDVAARGDMNGPWMEGCSFLESLGAERYHGRKYRDY